MPTEASSTHDIRNRLTAAGYRLVQIDSPIGGDKSLRADAIAWANDAEGSLVPWAVVEVKNGAKTPQILVLQQLIRARDLLGTVDHYAVLNGQWYKADQGLRHLEPVDAPTPPEHGTGAFLSDRELATSLVLDRLAYDEQAHARAGGRDKHALPVTDVFAETLMPGIDVPGVGFVPVDPDVLWQARRDALVRWATRSDKGSYFTSEPAIARAVAELAGNRIEGVVLDPFCGTGSFLWETLDRAKMHNRAAEFLGHEWDERLADIAEQIGRTAPMYARIEQCDSFSQPLPECNLMVSAPPIGVRMTTPHRLSDGSSTKDVVAAAIDACVRALRPDGRAVLHVPASFTYNTSSANYRQFLATTYRVAAVIGLPSVSFAGTSLRSTLLVIDKDAPGDSFVAQLGEDWMAQLSPGGAALEAALSHLDGSAAGA